MNSVSLLWVENARRIVYGFSTNLEKTLSFQCSKMRGRDCTRNADCACSNYQAVEGLICNYNLLKCESFFETLASRIPVSYSNTHDYDCSRVKTNTYRSIG